MHVTILICLSSISLRIYLSIYLCVCVCDHQITLLAQISQIFSLSVSLPVCLSVSLSVRLSLSLSLSLSCQSLLAGCPNYILCPHRAKVDKFLLVGPTLTRPFVGVYIYIYIYIYTERERVKEREKERERLTDKKTDTQRNYVERQKGKERKKQSIIWWTK